MMMTNRLLSVIRGACPSVSLSAFPLPNATKGKEAASRDGMEEEEE